MNERDESFDRLRAALSRLLAADRRQRGRDQQRPDGTLSHAHLRSLLVLGREEEVTAGTLARAADLNPASVTAMLDQLEEAGLVRRRRDTHDRRQCWVGLTDAGRAQLAAKERYWRTQMAEAFADVDNSEIAAAIKVMERVATSMEQRNRPPEDRPPLAEAGPSEACGS